jgi:hypothetical protein
MLRPSRSLARAAAKALRGPPSQALPRMRDGGGQGGGTVFAASHRLHVHGWRRRPLGLTAARARFTTAAADATTQQPSAADITAGDDDATSGDAAQPEASSKAAKVQSQKQAPAAPPASQKLPAFDYTALAASVCEIHNVACPTKVEMAVQADAYTLVLGLRGLEGKLALHVSWHPDAAVGLALSCKYKHQLMTASAVHVTHLTPGSDNPTPRASV